jgi:hypothetical protein
VDFVLVEEDSKGRRGHALSVVAQPARRGSPSSSSCEGVKEVKHAAGNGDIIDSVLLPLLLLLLLPLL